MDNRKTVFKDKVLICVDCEQSFMWTAGEQSFFQGRNLAQVKRCSACRNRRRMTVAPYLGEVVQ